MHSLIRHNPRVVKALRDFTQVASPVVILVGTPVLIGWALDVAALKSVQPGLALLALDMKARAGRPTEWLIGAAHDARAAGAHPRHPG
jgi:hypothetical protein